MKKVLLTAALLFSFAFTYANEKVSTNSESVQIVLPTNVEIYCFHTSCGVFCTSGAELTSQEIVWIMTLLEEVICSPAPTEEEPMPEPY